MNAVRDGDEGTKRREAAIDPVDLFAAFVHFRSIALAVSGGADSTALTLLVRQWLASWNGPPSEVTVLTVNHGLRPEAAAEAEWVAKLAANQGFSHKTLIWSGDKPSSGIQTAARQARYGLMSDYCIAHGIEALLTAHTGDDQAETVLMRLARGSGVDGLAGMAGCSRLSKLQLIRPLLGISRAELEHFLQQNGQDWLNDPSNLEPKYERVRVRRALRQAVRLGLSREKLALTARRLGRAREALDRMTCEFLQQHVTIHPAGYAEVSLFTLCQPSEEVGLRGLARLATVFGGQSSPPQLAKLETVYAKLQSDPTTLTLNGCQFIPRNETLLITREFGRMDQIEQVAIPGQTRLWDRRFKITFPPFLPENTTLRPLGAQGIRAVKTADGEFKTAPREALVTLPSLWQGDKLIYAPEVRFPTGAPQYWQNETEMTFSGREMLFSQA